MVRFVLLGLLTIRFGPDVVQLFGTLFRQHYAWFLGAIVAGVVVWLVMRRKRS
jgi:cytosine/uracil/thiamine/allantoin permease